MITESGTKLIRSLTYKKYRYKHGLFIAEGKKTILDMLNAGFSGIKDIYMTNPVFEEHQFILSKLEDKCKIVEVSDLTRISNLESTPEIVMIGFIPSRAKPDKYLFETGIHLYLDQIQDPGNVGTILRTAEWFGIKSIGMSEGCADFVHPKVIQASMGSFSRMAIWNGALPFEYLEENKIYAADLKGNSIYETPLPAAGLVIIGNEGNGIADYIRKKVNNFIRIPSYSKEVESLNAANATAIILSEWRRQLTS
ncbi:MAG: RNA methyltransferase [Saprospiraceae bacterium]